MRCDRCRLGDLNPRGVGVSEVVLYIAASLDGFIADDDGGVDWLAEDRFKDGVAPDEDYGYAKFYDGVELVIMGRKTYDQILGFGKWPYSGKHNAVFTQHPPQENPHGVEFVSGNVRTHVERWKRDHSGKLWLMGGGELNSAFRREQLVDRTILTWIPVYLGSGRRLFSEPLSVEPQTLIRQQTWPNGFVQVEYERIQI